MSRFPRRKLGLSIALALAGGAHGGESLPPLRIDPALLGSAPVRATPPVPTVPAPASSPAATVTPVQPPPMPTRVIESTRPTAQPAAAARPAPPPAPGVVHVEADRIEGKSEVQTVADGAVVLRKQNNTLTADHLVYREAEDEVDATGNVRLLRDKDEMTGPHLKMQVDKSVGYFESPTYTINRQPQHKPGEPPREAINGRGKASRLDFEGEDRYRFSDVTYSTCRADPLADQPDWYAKSKTLALDYQKEEGEGDEMSVVFKGVPILYAPSLSFSLNNQRKSGFLVPTIGGTSQSGMEATVPYYWNIAPDMDATIAPRLLTKRGLQATGQFRYLGQRYRGEVSGEYLPTDRVFGGDRSAFAMLHQQDFGRGFGGSLNLNRVSDDTYFRDLSTRLTNIAQTNLLREGRLFYNGGWWSTQLMAQRYQVLQDPSQPPVGIPYDRLPQLTLNVSRPDLPAGVALNMNGEFVKFSHPDLAQPEGRRVTLYPQFSLPLQTAAFYITPKIGLHATRYELERQTPGFDTSISRNVPIFSVDSGVTFERDVRLLGRDLLNTLEPRLYYLRVPYRDQSQIPLFDTGLSDFNFAQIFSENVYSGGDRLADANQLTAAVTSRLIDPASGNELVRVALGQRYYFSDQNATLPGQAPRTNRMADYLAGLTANLGEHYMLDSALQYNPRDKQVERFNFSGRYQPEMTKLINAGYRYTRELLSQIDVSGQWPVRAGWSAVGRYNYSVKEKRVIESIAGMEYNSGCWSTRFIVHRLATAVGRASTAFFVQLELNGFSRLGSNPLDMLKRNVPGYGRWVQPAADPVFGAE
ncbi:hypothetical protein B9N43_08500 [Denitratisoma sp. DHT3]|uniref:LPS-assembly protein LptD n=1 Tax=Denitratisoma sp. DHT3 TaxID=1981880 RepID=UPI00119879A7|nr:LPS-assembly protein LptD [Denitratisoma sp. DHT3]QDX81278.1 hypothetical protein B9N43_08500 [Denitratisoma sp. DHT3]